MAALPAMDTGASVDPTCPSEHPLFPRCQLLLLKDQGSELMRWPGTRSPRRLHPQGLTRSWGKEREVHVLLLKAL